MINKFLILRRDRHGNEDYFQGFDNRYIKTDMSEEYGIEKWTDNVSFSFEFESFIECKEWFRVLQRNAEEYSYEIILYRHVTEKDMSERGEICGSYIPLKTFYSTDEE